MSVRARRIREIIYSNTISFNLNHDEELITFLEKYGFSKNLNEGVGIAEIPIKTLKEAIKTIKNLDSETIKILQRDIKWSEQKGDAYIQYYCF